MRVRPVGKRDGRSHHPQHIERHFEQLRTLGIPHSLQQGRHAADHQSFGKREFEDADENEQEIHRHGPVDPRKHYLQPGSEQRNHQIADETNPVIGVPLEGGRGNYGHPDHRGEQDEELCAPGKRRRAVGESTCLSLRPKCMKSRTPVCERVVKLSHSLIRPLPWVTTSSAHECEPRLSNSASNHNRLPATMFDSAGYSSC